MGKRVRQFAWGTLIVFIGAYAVAHLTGEQGVSAMLAKRRQIQQMEEETQRLEQENKDLETYLEDLKSNPDRQRQLIRERLHYVEEGAVDFTAPSETSSGSSSSQR